MGTALFQKGQKFFILDQKQNGIIRKAHPEDSICKVFPAVHFHSARFIVHSRLRQKINKFLREQFIKLSLQLRFIALVLDALLIIKLLNRRQEIECQSLLVLLERFFFHRQLILRNFRQQFTDLIHKFMHRISQHNKAFVVFLALCRKQKVQIVDQKRKHGLTIFF